MYQVPLSDGDRQLIEKLSRDVVFSRAIEWLEEGGLDKSISKLWETAAVIGWSNAMERAEAEKAEEEKKRRIVEAAEAEKRAEEAGKSERVPRDADDSRVERILLQTVPWDARKEGGKVLQSCLRTLWDQATQIGFRWGEEQVESARKEGFEEGRAAGVREIVDQLNGVAVPAVADQRKELEQERMWGFEVGWRLCEEKMKTEVRDSSTEIAIRTAAPIPALDSAAVTAPSPSMSDVATHTDNVAAAAVAQAPFDWAEDAQGLSTHTPPSAPARDLSCLRTGRTQPFASLRRRDRRAPPSKFNSLCTRTRAGSTKNHSQYRTTAPPRSQARTVLTSNTFFRNARPPPHLDWDHDPRLQDLSRALTALGWMRAR
ncbi:hypothetical protein R3P38DRAFT_3072623 [Favolaschia claudopus]|uniref:Uncharacterized protein n=1 Tax=Favolaschia claudopus TaxID=2862362 RepID=A0AAV9ZXW2_9AGAR